MTGVEARLVALGNRAEAITAHLTLEELSSLLTVRQKIISGELNDDIKETS